MSDPDATSSRLDTLLALESFSSLEPLHLSFEQVYELVPGSTDRFMGGGLLLHRLRFANVTAALTVLAAAGAFQLPQGRW